MLVTGDNSLQLFLGWEGVGLASYLLLHFWFTRLQADKAAITAMPVNRVGDFGLAPGNSGCFTLFQTVDFSTIFACASAPRNSWSTSTSKNGRRVSCRWPPSGLFSLVFTFLVEILIRAC